ncbi:hypothetical protein [Lucifera butyrica]|uniref:hypothetical protein n=1 Tax=Lucifera butyrica TaxID=1351585 RepID=UPI0014035CE6|nr:hypothetical protein [Lucifera butyrica]
MKQSGLFTRIRYKKQIFLSPRQELTWCGFLYRTEKYKFIADNGRRIALSTMRRCHLTSAYDKTILLPGLFAQNDFQMVFLRLEPCAMDRKTALAVFLMGLVGFGLGFWTGGKRILARPPGI